MMETLPQVPVWTRRKRSRRRATRASRAALAAAPRGQPNLGGRRAMPGNNRNRWWRPSWAAAAPCLPPPMGCHRIPSRRHSRPRQVPSRRLSWSPSTNPRSRRSSVGCAVVCVFGMPVVVLVPGRTVLRHLLRTGSDLSFFSRLRFSNPHAVVSILHDTDRLRLSRKQNPIENENYPFGQRVVVCCPRDLVSLLLFPTHHAGYPRKTCADIPAP